tara:strand:- start:4539 stop:5171 length:633 start_codon:yes stop_codon:yes gene_type:complete
MPYVGINKANSQGFITTVKDRFSGDNSTTDFTLSQSASGVGDLEVFVGNVQQEPTIAYTVAGTTLSFTEAPSTGTNNIYVLHRGLSKQSILPPADLGSKNYSTTGTFTASNFSSWETDAKTSNFQTHKSKQYFVDTSGGAVTATLPDTAIIGDEIRFMDVAATFDTNNLTVDRNGHNIVGSAQNLVVADERAAFALVYYNATQGWLLKEK